MEEGYTCMNGSRQSGNVFLSTSPSSGPVAAYSNQPSSSYLTPTSPSSPQPPRLPAFPPSFGQPPLLSQPSGARHKNPSFPRTDSDAHMLTFTFDNSQGGACGTGIEADSPRSPTSSSSTAPSPTSPTATANPTASTLYEYIDPKDVHVETSQASTTQGESSSSGVSSATTAAYTGDIISDLEDRVNASRRRVNPMYEALENSVTRLYAQTCHCKMQSSAHRQLRHLWCAFIVLIFIVIFLLCVIAYILFMLVPGVKSHLHDQEDRIVQLETDYGILNRENDALLQMFSSNKSNSGALPEGSVVEMISQLNSSVWTFSSQLHHISTDLQQQIANISLTPGPQGPPGVGNLSRCFYKTSTSYQALPGPYSTSSWQPDASTLQDNIVMSAACGVIGGTQQFVETKVLSTNVLQFRCRCDGSVDSYDRRACVIHLVICPRLS